MMATTKNWMGNSTPAAWDPYEVWRQRILLPRLSEQGQTAAAAGGEEPAVTPDSVGSDSIED